ncbi:MAG: SDR family NAD(P)-dependent oxidoreductase [Anaerolineae bacterium]|nr:SDR family NAD(P)-dependent oxidoreductase [Anaerolineae bacterium]
MNTTVAPNKHTTFLVSGGAKGITARCVIELARRYQCHFVLLGRSEIVEPEPDWATGAEDERALKQGAFQAALAHGEKPKPTTVQRMARRVLSSREIRRTLDAVKAAGGTARYLSVDVTDRDALQTALAPVREGITGIIHGAGAIADKLIEAKTEADFDKVYDVKVGGLLNLLVHIPPAHLEHLVLFSSVAGFYGNVGQSDYALANEILDKTAHLFQRRHPHCRVLAINWGPWDGGMVTPALKRVLTSRGIDVIPIDVGTALLADELAGESAAQVVVGSPLAAPAREPEGALRTYRIRRRLTLADNPFLRDHVIGGHAVLPTVCAVAWMANACEQLAPGYTFFRSENYKALKGVVFDETLADVYTLELQEIAKDSDAITFEGVIRSASAEGQPRYHYSAHITLMRALPDAPTFAGFNVTASQPRDGATLYADNTLFHGPSFRGVDRVLNFSPETLTLRCHAPQVSPATQGQFPIQTLNPFLTDVQLQSLLIWAKQTYGYGGLPMHIQRGEQYSIPGAGDVTYASLRVQTSSKHRLVADVITHDEEGRVYSRVTGAEITLSPRLNALFAQNHLDESTEKTKNSPQRTQRAQRF